MIHTSVPLHGDCAKNGRHPRVFSSGFSLVEIIVALAMLGIIGVFGSMFVVSMVRNYQWADENAHLAQKAQVALTRIAAEMTYAESVAPDYGEDRIVYDAAYPVMPGEEVGSVTGMIRMNATGDELVLEIEGDDYTLVDRVAGFLLEENAENSALIDIELHLLGAADTLHIFTTSVALP